MYLRPGKFFRNQILLGYLGRWRNQSCQIFFQSVHSGVSGKGSNFAIFSVNRGWPLQLLHYRTTVIHNTTLLSHESRLQCRLMLYRVSWPETHGNNEMFIAIAHLQPEIEKFHFKVTWPWRTRSCVKAIQCWLILHRVSWRKNYGNKKVRHCGLSTTRERNWCWWRHDDKTSCKVYMQQHDL